MAVIISKLFSNLQNSSCGVRIGGNVNQNKKFLCSEVDDIRSEYAQNIQELFNTEHFLSNEFLEKLKEDANWIKGGLLCMPEEIHPSIAVCTFNKLVHEIKPHFERFLNGLLYCMRNRIGCAIIEYCMDFHVLQQQLLTEFDTILKEKKIIANNYLSDALESECVIYTHNHYYMMTVNEMEKSYSEVVETSDSYDDEDCDFIDGKNDYFRRLHMHVHNNKALQKKVEMLEEMVLKNNSNQELLLKKQAIKIAAYWKTMCKAFIDRTVKMAQLYLIVHPCSDKVHEQLHKEICKHDVNELMGVNSELEERIAINEKELENVERAQAIIRQIRIKN